LPAAVSCSRRLTLRIRIANAVGERPFFNRARIGLLQVLLAIGELDIVEPMAREALADAERHGRSIRTFRAALSRRLRVVPWRLRECRTALSLWIGRSVEPEERDGAQTLFEVCASERSAWLPNLTTVA
jgi:hypothetical protein